MKNKNQQSLIKVKDGILIFGKNYESELNNSQNNKERSIQSQKNNIITNDKIKSNNNKSKIKYESISTDSAHLSKTDHKSRNTGNNALLNENNNEIESSFNTINNPKNSKSNKIQANITFKNNSSNSLIYPKNPNSARFRHKTNIIKKGYSSNFSNISKKNIIQTKE